MADYSGEGRLLRAEDVAKQLQISITHAYRLMEPDGAITTFRIGRVVRVRAGDLDSFIREHLSTAGSKAEIQS